MARPVEGAPAREILSSKFLPRGAREGAAFRGFDPTLIVFHRRFSIRHKAINAFRSDYEGIAPFGGTRDDDSVGWLPPPTRSS